MSETATETPPQAVNVEEHARIVMAVLREYTDKVSALCRELSVLLRSYNSWKIGANTSHLDSSQAAWLLDQSELIRKPLETILSRGSGLRENAPLEAITKDVLSLRMVELEVHLHHMIRRTGELRTAIEKSRTKEQVARLRAAAGLNAMKGGPLRPDW